MKIVVCLFTILVLWKHFGVSAYKMYQPDINMCCNGTIHPWQTGRRCCETLSYHPDEHICCFGQLLPLPSKGLFGCCGNHSFSQIFQYGQKECCHEHVVDLPDANRYYGCCGQKIYYPNEEICCNGMVRTAIENETCCGEEMMDESSHICCQTWTWNNGNVQLTFAAHPLEGDLSGCCGLQILDWRSQMCCGGEVHHKNGSHRCCDGHELYDASTHACCHGRIYEKPRGSRLECCWTAMLLYDPETDFCCDSEVVPLNAVVANRTSCCSVNYHKNLHRP